MPQTVLNKFYDHRKSPGDDREMETTITNINDLDDAIASSEKPINLDLSHQTLDNMVFNVTRILTTRSITSISSINLTSNKLTDQDLIMLAVVLRTGRLPNKFTLNLSINSFNKKGLEFLAKALASGNCPEGLFLDLSLNHYRNPLANSSGTDFIAFGEALSTGHCPKNLALNFRGSTLSQDDLKSISNALASGNCPEGLHLKVDGRPSANPLFIFSQALLTGNCPQGLTLVFDQLPRKYFKKDFYLIKEAIISGRCPKNFELDFDSQFQFDKTLFSDLAEIIESHKYPDGFQIRFNDNNFFEESLNGSERLFKVMNQNNFIKHALLGIGISNFYARSLQVMQKQLQKYQPAPQFQLDLNTYKSSTNVPSVKKEIVAFLKNNELRHLALTYLTLSQGQRQETNILAKVTDDHVMHIMSFLLVIGANEKVLPEASQQSSEKKLLSLSNLRQYLFFDNKEQMLRAKVRENASLAKPGRCVIS